MNVGTEIRRKRLDVRLSQAALAEEMRKIGQAHWHQNTVSRVEAGKQGVNSLELVSLQEILRTPLAPTPGSVGLPTATLLSAHLDAVERTIASLTEQVTVMRALLHAGSEESAAA